MYTERMLMEIINDNWIALMIIAVGIASGLASIHFLIRGFKENRTLCTALAGNALIVSSTISALCFAMIL